jgi:hypothetical protein
MAEVAARAERQGAVTLHTKIKARVPQTDERRQAVCKRSSRPRRAACCSANCCQEHKVPFDAHQPLLTKKEIGDVIDQVYRHCGQKETVIFADRIMALGFRHAFKAGISFGKDDMVIPHQGSWSTRPRTQAQGVRAAVSGRPDHPGRKVQQGRRRLGQVRRQGRRRDDASIKARRRSTEEPAVRSRSTRST